MNQEPITFHTKQSRVAGVLALAATTLAFVSAAAAGPAADRCQAGKNVAAGTYFACLAKAEKDFVQKSDVVRYDTAVAKCEARLVVTWNRLEASATAAGDPCPSLGDGPGVKEMLDGCSGGVSQSAAGGMPPPSPLVCEADLATCESNSGVPATGQTTSYGAGSDGAEQRGVARSFTDNGDGTITDNVTGLIWEKKSDDGSIHDKDDTYTWGQDSAPFSMEGSMVTTFLAALNSGGGFAGYTDWRIPNLNELETLRDLDSVGPVTFPEFNNGCMDGCTVSMCSCTRPAGYWSSSTSQDAPGTAMYVFFDHAHGQINAVSKTSGNGVRAVRGGA